MATTFSEVTDSLQCSHDAERIDNHSEQPAWRPVLRTAVLVDHADHVDKVCEKCIYIICLLTFEACFKTLRNWAPLILITSNIDSGSSSEAQLTVYSQDTQPWQVAPALSSTQLELMEAWMTTATSAQAEIARALRRRSLSTGGRRVKSVTGPRRKVCAMAGTEQLDYRSRHTVYHGCTVHTVCGSCSLDSGSMGGANCNSLTDITYIAYIFGVYLNLSL